LRGFEKIKDTEVIAVPSFQKSNYYNNTASADIQVDVHSGNKEDGNKPFAPQLSNEDIKIPQFAEFLDYAKTLSAYQTELDSAIKDKYKGWKDKGWKSSSDRLITNWKSSLKSTLPFLKDAGHLDQLSLQNIPDIKRPISTRDNNQQSDV